MHAMPWRPGWERSVYSPLDGFSGVVAPNVLAVSGQARLGPFEGSATGFRSGVLLWFESCHAFSRRAKIPKPAPALDLPRISFAVSVETPETAKTRDRVRAAEAAVRGLDAVWLYATWFKRALCAGHRPFHAQRALEASVKTNNAPGRYLAVHFSVSAKASRRDLKSFGAIAYGVEKKRFPSRESLKCGSRIVLNACISQEQQKSGQSKQGF